MNMGQRLCIRVRRTASTLKSRSSPSPQRSLTSYILREGGHLLQGLRGFPVYNLTVSLKHQYLKFSMLSDTESCNRARPSPSCPGACLTLSREGPCYTRCLWVIYSYVAGPLAWKRYHTLLPGVNMKSQGRTWNTAESFFVWNSSRVQPHGRWHFGTLPPPLPISHTHTTGRIPHLIYSC